ncbi:hypothetical protein YC2023_115100 [Brassica napus]
MVGIDDIIKEFLPVLTLFSAAAASSGVYKTNKPIVKYAHVISCGSPLRQTYPKVGMERITSFHEENKKKPKQYLSIPIKSYADCSWLFNDVREQCQCDTKLCKS